jgi:hypothetical protein
MAFIKEVHSDDKHTPQGRRVRQKLGRNPVAARFFIEEVDVQAEEYRKRNAKPGQKYVSNKLVIYCTINLSLGDRNLGFAKTLFYLLPIWGWFYRPRSLSTSSLPSFSIRLH